MSSFIGCKISLISKAGIRYEGILYTIDPRESTVALSKVKSFGTEDRKVDRIIPPRDEIYEYIIFRGSDIQDLNVCEPNKESSLLSEDSAIVRAETSISGNLPPGVMSSGMHHIDSAWPSNNRLQNIDKPIINNSKSAINSSDQQNSAAQPAVGSNRFSQSNNENVKKQQQFHKSENYKLDGNNEELKYEHRGKIKSEKQSQKYLPEKYNSNHHDYDYNYDSNYKHQGNSYRASCDYGQSRDYYHIKQTGRYRNDYRRDQYYNNMDVNKLRGFESSETGRDYSSYSQYYDYKPRNGHEKYSNMYDNNPKIKKKPVRGENDVSKKDETFKEDYDFETANAIIAKELAALNISQDKKDLKDEECEKEDGQLSENSDAGYYDKTKSFFDNISSEMLDRANGKSVRPMNRKEERKINVETFGVAEANRNLGRNSSKWNRNSRYYSKPNRGSNFGGTYRGNSNEMPFKKDFPYKTNNNSRGYYSGRRPVLADGPGRGDDY